MVALRIRKITQIGLLTLASLQLLNSSTAFTVNINRDHSGLCPTIEKRTCLHMIDVVGGPPRPIPANDDDVKLTVDCTVQTTVELKAHQVGKKGIGSFGNDKSFQPIDWDKEGGVSRSEKCLVMPKGLRGVVVSMFDTSSKSSISHPVRVKFLGGDGLGGEYTPPVTFQMHFKTSEVELVDE